MLEFQAALKFKSCLADVNLIQLVQFVMVDAGGKMNDFSIVEGDWDIEFGQVSNKTDVYHIDSVLLLLWRCFLIGFFDNCDFDSYFL